VPAIDVHTIKWANSTPQLFPVNVWPSYVLPKYPIVLKFLQR
jgi:hypothetical protein